jgi:hypothetical protein
LFKKNENKREKKYMDVGGCYGGGCYRAAHFSKGPLLFFKKLVSSIQTLLWIYHEMGRNDSVNARRIARCSFAFASPIFNFLVSQCLVFRYPYIYHEMGRNDSANAPLHSHRQFSILLVGLQSHAAQNRRGEKI